MGKDEEAARIFLVRHGVTDWNGELKYQGRTDIPLNDSGFEQARRAGFRLSEIVFERVFSSPLRRAHSTAEAIMSENAVKTPIETLDDLREISFGKWEGLTAGEIMERHQGDFDAWREDPFASSPTGGESYESVTLRAARAAEIIADASRPGAQILAVAHGVILRALTAAFIKTSDPDVMWRTRCDNCSISAVDLWHGRPLLVFTNDTHHLRLNPESISLLSFP